MLSLMTSMVMEVKCCAVCAFNSRILLQHLSSLYDLKEQTILKLSLTELNEISFLTAYTYRLHKQSSTSALPSASKTHTFKRLIQHSQECHAQLGIVHPYTKAEKKERVIPLLFFYFSVTMFSILKLFIFSPCKWVNQPHKTTNNILPVRSLKWQLLSSSTYIYLWFYQPSSNQAIYCASRSLITLIAGRSQDDPILGEKVEVNKEKLELSTWKDSIQEGVVWFVFL